MKIKKLIASVAAAAVVITTVAVTPLFASAVVDGTCAACTSASDSCTDCSSSGDGCSPSTKCNEANCTVCNPKCSACESASDGCTTCDVETCSPSTKCSNNECTVCNPAPQTGECGCTDTTCDGKCEGKCSDGDCNCKEADTPTKKCTCPNCKKDSNCKCTGTCSDGKCADCGDGGCKPGTGTGGENQGGGTDTPTTPPAETDPEFEGYFVVVKDAEESGNHNITIAVGDTVTFHALVYKMANANDTSGALVENAEVTWESNNETVATVNNGVVTAVAEGMAEIWAYYPADDIAKTDKMKSYPTTVTVEAAEEEIIPDDDPNGDIEDDGDDDDSDKDNNDKDNGDKDNGDKDDNSGSTATPPSSDSGSTTTPPASNTGSASLGGGSSAPGAAPAGASIPSSNIAPASSKEAASSVKNTTKPSITIQAPADGIKSDVLAAFKANKSVKKITVKYNASLQVTISKSDMTGKAADLDFTKGKNFLTKKQISSSKLLKDSKKLVQLNFDNDGDFGGLSKVGIKSNVGKELKGKTATVYEYKDGKIVKIASGKVSATGNLSFNIDHYGQYVVAVK